MSIVYEPDTVSTATIVGSLAKELHALGHDVHVVSSVPHWNQSAGERSARFTTTTESGVTVTRCFAPRRRPSLLHRAAGLVMLHLEMLEQMLRRRDRDVVLVISPPLTFGFLGFLHRALWGSKVVYTAQELWPDVPRDLGIIRNRALLALLGGMERTIYRRADAVVAIGQHFADAVIARGAAPGQVRLIPNFVDPDTISPITKRNRLAAEWDLSSTPVLLYAGNIGLTQDWALLLDSADRLPHMTFLLVGDGAGRAAVEAELRRRKLRNVRVEDFVERSRVSELYGLCDVVLVPLGAEHGRTTVPSKIYSAMAAQRPILATALPDTDLAVEVRRASAGLVVRPADVDAFVAAARALCDLPTEGFDPAIAAGAVLERTPQVCAHAYDDLLRQLG